MSDERGAWQAPGSDASGDRPRYGEYAPPGGGTPPVAPSQAPQGGWTPPPKPGVVPLRPLGFGLLLLAPFKVLRSSRAVLGLSVALQFAVLVLGGGLLFVAAFAGLGRVTDFEDPDQSALIAGGIAGLILSGVALMIMSFVVSALMQGVVVVDVSRGVLGRRARLGELWRAVRPRLLALVGWTLLLFLATAMGLAVIAGVVLVGVLLVDSMGGGALAVSIPLAVLLALGFVVLAVWLGVKLSLVPSAIVLERLPIRAAASRSWRLVQGNFWRTFGVQALVTLIVNVAAQVVTGPLSLFLGILSSIVDPNGTGAGLVIVGASTVLTTILSILIGAISVVIISAATAFLYLDLRMRKEGLDLVLQRHVEDPAAVPDPYAPEAA